MNRLSVVLLDASGNRTLADAVRRAIAELPLDAAFHERLADVAPQEAGIDATTPTLVCVLGDATAAMEQLAALHGDTRGPQALLSPPLDPQAHEDLVRLGVHAWGTVDAVTPDTLRALLARAQARWQRESALRVELVQLRTKMEDRKWVDKAKGLLMVARGMSEDDAFALLQRSSMHANLKLGDIARSVVDAAQWAEAINRSGQLRMLAQRLARLAAQALAGVDVARGRDARRETAARIKENLAFLGQLKLGSSAAEALAVTTACWQALGEADTVRSSRNAAAAVDTAAEALLASAEALTDALQTESGRRALRILNLCGRQRMLAERLAKEALFTFIALPEKPRELAPAAQEFEAALAELERAPLSSAEIRASITAAREDWLRFARSIQGLTNAKSGVTMVRTAEALVEIFDKLAAQYEHSVQVILS
jgi:AmiR/NasT family two-component response regulator